MSALNHQEEISIERIERTLKVAAYVVVRYGKAYAPHVERLEGEFKRARGNDPIAKARAIWAFRWMTGRKCDGSEYSGFVLKRGARAIAGHVEDVTHEVLGDALWEFKRRQPVLEGVAKTVNALAGKRP